MAAYESMKDSGIKWMGLIPSHWNLERAKFNFTQTNNRGNATLILLAASQKYGMCPQNMLEGVVKVAENTDLQQFKTVHINDFVISLRSFQGGFERSDYEGVCSPAYQVFSANQSVYDVNYLKHLFKNEMFIDEMNSLTVGIREGKNIKYEDFANSLLFVLPLSEQSAIAAYLDDQCAKIDALIDEAKNSIEEYKKWKASLIFEAVTKGLDPNVEMKDSGVEWIGKIPNNYQIAPIRWLIALLTDYTANGSFGDLAKNVSYKDSPDYARLVRLTDLRINFENDGIYVDEHAYNYLSKSSLFGGEILLANVGAYAGLAVEMPKVPFLSTLGPNMFLIKMDEHFLDQHFAYYALYGSYCHQQLVLLANKTTAQPKLNKDNLKSISVVLPPLEDQRIIAKYLDEQCEKIDNIICEKETLIVDLENYKKSLVYEVVTGKRKVV